MQLAHTRGRFRQARLDVGAARQRRRRRELLVHLRRLAGTTRHALACVDRVEDALVDQELLQLVRAAGVPLESLGEQVVHRT